MQVTVGDLLWLFLAGAGASMAMVSGIDHLFGLLGYEWAVGVALFAFSNYKVRSAGGDRDADTEETPA